MEDRKPRKDEQFVAAETCARASGAAEINAYTAGTIPRTKADITAIQAVRKRYAVRQAMRAPLFRGKLDQVDIDRLDDPHEWEKIPLLDKDMLRGMSDREFYRDFCLQPMPGDSIAQYWRSGGTTGRPLFYPRSRNDIEAAMRGFVRVYACAGARSGELVHCAFPLGIHPVGTMMAQAPEAFGMGVLWAGAGTTTPSTLQIELIDKLSPDIFIGMSSYALHLANVAEHHNIDLANGSVKLIICSAEPLSAAKREKIGRMWGADVRDSFGMTEAGMMAAEDEAANDITTTSPRLTVRTSAPTFDDADRLMPHAAACLDRFQVAVGPEIAPTNTGAGDTDDRITRMGDGGRPGRSRRGRRWRDT